MVKVLTFDRFYSNYNDKNIYRHIVHLFIADERITI